MKKTCVLCNQEFETIKNGYTRKYCFDCVPQYKLGDRKQQQEAMNVKHRKIKAYLVEYKGGKCELCGYNKCIDALHFHHPDDNKEFGISATFHSIEDYKKEVDKCRLLCSNCHAEEHEKMRNGSVTQWVEYKTFNFGVGRSSRPRPTKLLCRVSGR